MELKWICSVIPACYRTPQRQWWLAACSTFSDVVSQEGVVDFGALSVLAHLKLREGDPPARPSWGEGSNPCSLSPPRLRPCCSGLAKRTGTRHPGKTAGRKETKRELEMEWRGRRKRGVWEKRGKKEQEGGNRCAGYKRVYWWWKCEVDGGKSGDGDRRGLSLGRPTIRAHSMPNGVTFVRHSAHSLSKIHVCRRTRPSHAEANPRAESGGKTIDSFSRGIYINIFVYAYRSKCRM